MNFEDKNYEVVFNFGKSRLWIVVYKLKGESKNQNNDIVVLYIKVQ